jgi:hypothetical protein
MDAKPMDAKTFDVMLNRLGTNFSHWPLAEAEQAKKLLVNSAQARRSYEMLLRIEALIDNSRPHFVPAQAQRVVHRTLAEITRRDAMPSLLERFRVLLTAPVPLYPYECGRCPLLVLDGVRPLTAPGWAGYPRRWRSIFC